MVHLAGAGRFDAVQACYRARRCQQSATRVPCFLNDARIVQQGADADDHQVFPRRKGLLGQFRHHVASSRLNHQIRPGDQLLPVQVGRRRVQGAKELVGPILVAAGYTGHRYVQPARVDRPKQGLANGPTSNDPYRLGHGVISLAFYLADKMVPFRRLRMPRPHVCSPTRKRKRDERARGRESLNENRC